MYCKNKQQTMWFDSYSITKTIMGLSLQKILLIWILSSHDRKDRFTVLMGQHLIHQSNLDHNKIQQIDSHNEYENMFLYLFNDMHSLGFAVCLYEIHVAQQVELQNEDEIYIVQQEQNEEQNNLLYSVVQQFSTDMNIYDDFLLAFILPVWMLYRCFPYVVIKNNIIIFNC